MNRVSPPLAIWLIAVTFCGTAQAFETDQYLVWGRELEDSAEILNEYINDSIETYLSRLNRRKPERVSCQEIPPRIYQYLFRGLYSSQLLQFLKSHPEVDRWPDREVGYLQYLGDSLYRKPTFPFYLPLSRTIRLGDVYMGTDKLGHLFGFGRRYYLRYHRAREDGRTEQEAMSNVILWGLRLEKTLVGGITDGVFSHADLEANFQGLRLARNMCEGESPHLALADGTWRLARAVDLRDYVNPGFDETYNTSQYPWFRWGLVKPILIQEYCAIWQSPAIQERMAHYRTLDEGSFSRQVVEQYFRNQGKNLQAEQSLEAICPPASRSDLAQVSK